MVASFPKTKGEVPICLYFGTNIHYKNVTYKNVTYKKVTSKNYKIGVQPQKPSSYF
jgi:hypothetical protein